MPDKIHSFKDDPPKENCVILVLCNGGGVWECGSYYKSSDNVHLENNDYMPALSYFSHWREMPDLP